MQRTSRRRFVGTMLALAGSGLWSGCGVLPRWGDQPATVPRLGHLSLGSAESEQGWLVDVRQGLRELGHVEGQTFTIDSRYAERDDQLPARAAELVGLPVDIILSASSQATPAAKQATATVPIVMAHGGDPIAAGLVASLARPGGNVTGLTSIAPQLIRKRLGLLREVVPGTSRVAVLWNPGNPAKPPEFREAQDAAAAFGLELQSLEVRGPGDLDGAFRAALSARAEALLALSEGLINSQFARIAAFATERRLPSIGEVRLFPDAGGLMNYGANISDIRRRAATYVDKLLKGAKPADLPVEQPTTFDFVINLTTARAIGLVVPPSVLEQATEVIQ
jgi:putative tryptophan/tyrosine transport system substrate-binding protein